MQIVTTAPLLVEEFEKLPPGDRWAETLHKEASSAIAEKRAAAAAALFNQDVVPASADLLALYKFHTDRWAPSRHADGLIALHQRALGTVPMLCALLRSPEAMQDLAAAAGSTGTPASFQETHQQAQDAAAARARARVETAIARQLVAAAGGELAAAAHDLIAAEDLAARLELARQRHETAAAEIAAQAAAKARADQAAADDAADAIDAAKELELLLVAQGLPRDLRTGPFVEAQRERMTLLARARRRLKSTAVESIRLDLGQGTGLYGCKSLALGLGGSSVETLRAIMDKLDRAEGRTAGREQMAS